MAGFGGGVESFRANSGVTMFIGGNYVFDNPTT
jgi:hypothetical protein